LVVFFL
jgi:hypothetical protein